MTTRKPLNGKPRRGSLLYKIARESKKNLRLFLSALLLTVCGSAQAAQTRTGPWTKKQAWKWYNAQPWIRGCNYVGPASSPNRYD